MACSPGAEGRLHGPKRPRRRCCQQLRQQGTRRRFFMFSTFSVAITSDQPLPGSLIMLPLKHWQGARSRWLLVLKHLQKRKGLAHCAQLARVEQSCRNGFARVNQLAGIKYSSVPASAQTSIGRVGSAKDCCSMSEASKLMAAVAAFTAAGADYRRRLLLDTVLNAASRLRCKPITSIQ